MELWRKLCYLLLMMWPTLQPLLFAVLQRKVTKYSLGCQASISPSWLIWSFLRSGHEMFLLHSKQLCLCSADASNLRGGDCSRFLSLPSIFFLKNFKMIFPPLQHHVDYGNERLPKVGYPIFRPWRKLRIDCLDNKSVLLHLTELYVKDTGRGLWETLMNLARPLRTAVPQLIEYARFPFWLYQTHGEP